MDEEYPEGSGDNVDAGHNLTHDREGQRYAREQETGESILSKIALMMGDSETSPTQQPRKQGMLCNKFLELYNTDPL